MAKKMYFKEPTQFKIKDWPHPEQVFLVDMCAIEETALSRKIIYSYGNIFEPIIYLRFAKIEKTAVDKISEDLLNGLPITASLTFKNSRPVEFLSCEAFNLKEIYICPDFGPVSAVADQPEKETFLSKWMITALPKRTQDQFPESDRNS